MRPNTVTERVSDDQHLRSLDDTIFVAELFRVINQAIKVLATRWQGDT